nr:hypothetical protein [Desulfobulbaceae bacterium]
MKISKKALMSTVVAGTVTLGLMGVSSSAFAEKYEATYYVAGMGGHFAKAEVSIDTSRADTPMRLKKLTMIEVGSRPTHPLHDARIDSNDANTMYWSTYAIDKSAQFANVQVAHVGSTDLSTGETTRDVLVDLPIEATKTGSLYCASAQSKDYFLPISMANKGYIDVFQKSDLKRVQRIMLEGTEGDIGKPYKFYHGTNSPDFKKLLITINESDTDHGKTVGKMHLLELDMDKALKGEVKVNKKGLATGTGTFVSFRQYYSPDGSMIANSAGNAMLLIDANTLEVIDHEPMGKLEENHDAMFTPDGKYVIATARSKALLPNCQDPEKPGPDEYIMDGTLKLYDVAAKKFIGESISVCSACHQTEGIEEHAVLCGLDAIYH